MSDNPDSQDKSLEALDFIINALREHEKVLDRSIHELATVNEQMGDSDVLNKKVETLEEKMNSLQREVTTLIEYLSSSLKGTILDKPITMTPTQAKLSKFPAPIQNGQYVTLHCTLWADFEKMATQAHSVSFNYKDTEKILQVDAIKENQIITYTGVLPNFSLILKNWLSRQLDTTEGSISEGYVGN